jgi:hypothetical protein
MPHVWNGDAACLGNGGLWLVCRSSAMMICNRGDHGLETGLQYVRARAGCLLHGWLRPLPWLQDLDDAFRLPREFHSHREVDCVQARVCTRPRAHASKPVAAAGGWVDVDGGGGGGGGGGGAGAAVAAARAAAGAACARAACARAAAATLSTSDGLSCVCTLDAPLTELRRSPVGGRRADRCVPY